MALDRKQLIKPTKKLKKVVDKIDRQPTPARVHDLRANARRLEAIVDALELDDQGTGKSMVKNLRRLRQRAGKVRDMDVLTNYASTVRAQGDEDCFVQLL